MEEDKGTFYTALTGKDFTDTVVAPDKAKRDEYFARTFKGLGHQMHLIQDAAQPDHVRNDAHPEDAIFGKNILNGSRYFETWAKEEDKSINSYAANPILPGVSLNLSYNNLVPITQFIDTDQYNGMNPTTSLTQGISEYANANFFSGDTIFASERYSTSDRHYFPYPKRSSTDLQSFIAGTKPPETITDVDGNTDTGIWISKLSDGEAVGHLVRTSSLTKIVYNLFGEGALFYSTFYRDEKCHEDYAQKLIPRAVGYSAGLLNYFFRGTIEITLPDKGVYSFSDASSAGFTNISLHAKNITPNNEEMPDGSIELVVKYRPSATEDYSYKVFPEKNNIRSIPRDNTVELTFDLSQDLLPFSTMDIYLQVVYKGKLGLEDGAIAVGFKDISEPTPIDIFNNMDKICLNGTWYNAGSPEAIAQVDKNNDGIAFGTNEWDVYPHDLTNIYIRFYNNSIGVQYASPTEYDFKVTDLKAGSPIKALYILGDDEFHYSFLPSRIGTDPNDYWTHIDPPSLYHGFTIKDIIGDPPVYYNIRGYPIWSGSGFIYINPPYPTDSYCSFDLL